MSDTSGTDSAGTPPPSSPPPPPPPAIPVAREAPKARIDAGSVLKLQDETCPKCGALLEPSDVVCLKCGYDLRANKVRTTETGVEAVGGEAGSSDVFVVPGWGSAKVWAIVGGVIALGAMVASGMNVPPAGSKWTVVIGAVLLAVYNIAVHTGTGLAAVAVAARICEQTFGSLELAAARVFAAFSAFELVRHLKLPLGKAGPSVAYLLAAGVYFLAIWGLFRKTRAVTLLIVLGHVVLWILVQLGMELAQWVHAAPAGATGGP